MEKAIKNIINNDNVVEAVKLSYIAKLIFDDMFTINDIMNGDTYEMHKEAYKLAVIKYNKLTKHGNK